LKGGEEDFEKNPYDFFLSPWIAQHTIEKKNIMQKRALKKFLHAKIQ
jgi:hypothetical protein